jgi:ATP-dependent Clp protease protease subunit
MMKTALLSCVLTLCLAGPARAQLPFMPVSLSTPTPEQVELTKITVENMLAEQKFKRKMEALNEQKEDLRLQYELFLQKAKLKNSELETEIERLTNDNKLSAEKQRRDIGVLQAALEKAVAENALARERLKVDLDRLEAEYGRLSAQNKIADEKVKAETAKSAVELQKLNLANALSVERSKAGLLALAQRADKLRLENDFRTEEERALALAEEKENRSIALAMKRMDLEERKIKIEMLALDSRQARLKSELDLREKRWEWKKESNTDPVYTARPFRDGRLVISDRRVPLNGPIYTGVATYVTERIHYYNNISSAPIFLVIDRCPGGSVMEGYRIIKAMQASKAPVYVVVKSFAASMAAVITTLADKSYVYPNAIVLHHQMSTVNWGNMTQLKEQLELAREWEKRLHAPVARKMGISQEAFRKKMYEKSSDGDWEEFGDQAVGYKWAGAVVHEIEETGFLKNPDFADEAEKKKETELFRLAEKTDEKGARYVSLPRLDPFDFYFIYNPDRYYR